MVSSFVSPSAAEYMSSVTPLLKQITTGLLSNTPADPEQYILEMMQGTLRAKAAASNDIEKVDVIEILHFNDVYNIEGQSREPVGGAPRFVTKVEELRKSIDGESLVLFSGDAFNPSLMSTVTKGKQMVPILNAAKVDVACMGNHDFDFGIENLVALVQGCTFPWLMSNVTYKPTGRALAEGERYVIKVVGGRRIGFIGVVEKDWMATLSTIEEEVRACEAHFWYAF